MSGSVVGTCHSHSYRERQVHPKPSPSLPPLRRRSEPEFGSPGADLPLFWQLATNKGHPERILSLPVLSATSIDLDAGASGWPASWGRSSWRDLADRDFQVARGAHELRREGFGYGPLEDEALGRETDLTRVLEAESPTSSGFW